MYERREGIRDGKGREEIVNYYCVIMLMKRALCMYGIFYRNKIINIGENFILKKN